MTLSPQLLMNIYQKPWQTFLPSLQQEPILTTADPQVKKELVIWRAYWDMAYFARTFLSNQFRFPFSSLHLDLMDMISNGQGERGRRFAIAAPRGNAKTTVMHFLQCLHAICYGYEKNIVIVGHNQTESAEKVSMLLDELRHNQRIRQVFGELAPSSSGGRFSFKTKNGVYVKAVSRGQSIRGQQRQGHRPTLIILDDVETLDEVQNPVLREQTWDWLNRDIIPAGEVDGTTNIIVIGTCLHQDALLPRLMNHPTWTAHKYQSIQSYSENQHLWDEWRLRHTDLSNPNREADAQQYYESNREDMLQGTQVLWPEVEDYRKLMIQQIELGILAFNAEKQNEPYDPESCIFNMDDAHYFEWMDDNKILFNTIRENEVAIDSLHTVYAFLDPCVGESVGGDDAALVIVGKDSEGFIYVLDAWLAAVPVNQQLNACKELYKQWHFSTLYIESNGFQSLLANQIKEQLETKEDGPRVLKASSTSNKELRIAQLQPLIASGRLVFYKGIESKLIQQFTDFPTAIHDDGPDALAGAVSKIYSKLNPREPKKRRNVKNRRRMAG